MIIPVQQSGTAGRPVSAASRRKRAHASTLTVYGVALMLMALTAMNSVPAWFSSTLVVIVIAPLLVLWRGFEATFDAAFRGPGLPVMLAMLVWFLFNLVSAIATPTDLSVEAVIQRSIFPLMIMLAMSGLRLSSRDGEVLLAAFSIGCGFLFMRGLIAYLLEFGVPDMAMIMWSRYDQMRIRSYGAATAGNVARMGVYIALVAPVIFFAALRVSQSRGLRFIHWFVFTLAVFNLIVSGSRTGLLIVLAACVGLLLTLNLKRLTELIFSVGAILVACLPLLVDQLFDDDFVRRYLPSRSAAGYDNSAWERWESIVIGWKLFQENFVLGIGPGNSPLRNYFSIPHQSVVEQLSEVGLFGALAFVALNLIVLWSAFRAWLAARRGDLWRLCCLVGPASYYLFGFLAGLSFNMGLSSGWSGINAALLALATARLSDDRAA